MNVIVCPKCGGQGHVEKPPWIAGDVHSWSACSTGGHVCDLCKGAKIIASKEPSKRPNEREK